MSNRFIGPLSILSYPHLAEPQKSDKPGKKPKYSGAFVITPETLQTPAEKARLDAIKARMIEVGQTKWSSNFEKLVKGEGFKKGIRTDAESKGYPDGSIYFNARSDNQPGLVYSYADPTTGKPAVVPVELIKKVFYAGAIVRPLITVFAFDQEGSKGLSFGLEGIQFVKDGPRIDGRVAAEDAFDVDLSAQPASLDDII